MFTNKLGLSPVWEAHFKIPKIACPSAMLPSSVDLHTVLNRDIVYWCTSPGRALFWLIWSKTVTFAASGRLICTIAAHHLLSLSCSCFDSRLSFCVDAVSLLFDLVIQRRRERARNVSTSRASMVAFEDVSASGWERVVLRSICHC